MRNLRWYLLRAGLPIGLMIGVGAGILGAGALWWDTLLTVGVSAILIAAILMAATETFVRVVPRTMLTVGILVAIVLVLTVLSGVGLLVAASRIPHGRWSRLPDLPVPAQSFAGPSCYKLVGRDDGVVVLAARDQGYLVYHPERGSSGSWTIESTIPEEILGRAVGCKPLARGSMTPPIAGEIIARYRIDDDGVDCGGRRHYVLKADGGVWEWATGACALASLMGMILYLGALIAIGFLLGESRLSALVLPQWRRSTS